MEGRLLIVNDLVTTEAKYHVSSRVNFEKPVPQNKTPGRPASTEKVTMFNKACEILEEDIDLSTVFEFHNIMSSLGNNIYMLKMTQLKLQEKYGDSMKLATRDGKSNIRLLERVADILFEQWHNERKTNISSESERAIRTAVKLLREAIKNNEHKGDTYPAPDDIMFKLNNAVPHLLEVFLKEFVKSPIKQKPLSEAIYSATRPRSLMPLQFGLAVAANNHLALKLLNNLLYKLGFVVSYDEVRTLQNNHLKMILKVLVIFSAGGDYFPIKNDAFNIANHFHSRFVSTRLLSYKMFE